MKPQWRPDSGVMRLLGFALAFFIAYEYAMNMTARSGAPFWLPDSVLLCALLLSRPRTWFVYLAATLPIRLTVAVPPQTPTWFLLAAFANDSLKALLSATLLRWLFAGRSIRFDCLRDFWNYLAAAVVVSPALSGVAGAAMWVARGRQFWSSWRNWFFGDALANLVMTTLLLCLALDWRKIIKARPLRYLEGCVVFSGLFFALQQVYHQSSMNSSGLDFHHYVPVVFLLLTAVRFGPAGVSGSLAMISLIWIAATGAGQPSDDNILSIQLFLIVTGVPILSLSVLMEQQRRTEHSLRESEMRFRNMANSAPVMIWVSDSDKGCTFFNKGWLDFTGRTMEQELGDRWVRDVHSDDVDQCLETYSRAFDARHRFRMEYRLRRDDGEYRWILDEGIPRFSLDGAFAGYIGSCVDITEMKRSQETESARQKLETIGQLAKVIAHDFNNLLGGILATAELCLMQLGEQSPEQELRTIRTAAIRGSELVRELLTYGGTGPTFFEPVDLSVLVHEMVQLLKASITKQATLEAHLAADLPKVRGNAAQLQQVVMNLVTNAAEAIGERVGLIRVTTAQRCLGLPAGSSDEAGPPPGNYVVLEVSDTGSGIAPEVRAKIFDPFFTTKATGHGLGLAAVQGIVRSHLGVITVATAVGEGTRFTVVLPSIEQRSDAPQETAVPTSAIIPQLSGTILIVEDEEPLRDAVAKMLQKKGVAVIEAAEGTTALELLRAETTIEVILLDVNLPGMSGRDVMVAVHQLRPQATIILTSVYDQDATATSGTNPQAWAFLRKPYQLADLWELICEAYRHKDRVRQAAWSPR